MNRILRITGYVASLAVASLSTSACNDDPTQLGTGGSGGSGGATSATNSSSNSSSSMSSSSSGGNGGDGGSEGGMGGAGGNGMGGAGGDGGAGGSGLPQCGMVGEWVCVADIDDDGTIGVSDLTMVLAQFGCPVGMGDPDCDVADVTRDGVVDGNDSDVTNVLNSHADCTGTPPKPDFWMSAADVDGSGVVDTSDLLAVNASFGCTDASLACLAADVTRDGVVNTTDTDVLQAVWAYECQP